MLTSDAPAPACPTQPTSEGNFCVLGAPWALGTGPEGSNSLASDPMTCAYSPASCSCKSKPLGKKQGATLRAPELLPGPFRSPRRFPAPEPGPWAPGLSEAPTSEDVFIDLRQTKEETDSDQLPPVLALTRRRTHNPVCLGVRSSLGATQPGPEVLVRGHL